MTTESNIPEAELLPPEEAQQGEEALLTPEPCSVAFMEERHKADMLRLAADMENLKKRTAKEVADARDFAVQRFAQDLLSVADGLKLALNTAGDDEFSKGVKLVADQLGKVLAQNGIEAVKSVGEPLNPDVHEAIQSQASEEVETGVILSELQAGYTLKGRLLRPALVVVAA